MKRTSIHSTTQAQTQGKKPSRDLLLGLASAAPSGFFLGSAVFQSAPGFGALILLLAILAGLGIRYRRSRHPRREEAPLLTDADIAHELTGAPAPPTGI